MRAIQLSIADDHPMVIKGIQNIMADYSNISVEGVYATGAALLNGLQSKIPDVLLLDIHLPDKSGDELAPFLIRNYPYMKILTLTNADSALYVRNMLRYGVHGYALKTIDPAMLVQAIEKVYNGEQYIDPAIKDKTDDSHLRNKKETFLKAKLTLREKEILKLVADGLTGQEIAAKLFVGFKTVESYRINLLLKLDVKNTASLIKKAMELGLLD